MKIEVGMYVRYKRGSNGYGIEPPARIAKVIDRINDSDFLNLDNEKCILENDVVKASYNIIDLIEIGDYVNGVLVDSVPLTKKINMPSGRWRIVNCTNEDIKSIVTKEQFEYITYKVS